MPSGFLGFSWKPITRSSPSTCITPNSRAWARGYGEAGDREVGVAAAMALDHGGVVHLVDVVAGQDQRIAGLGLLDRVDVLIDRVGRALIPVLAILCWGGITSMYSSSSLVRNRQP